MNAHAATVTERARGWRAILQHLELLLWIVCIVCLGTVVAIKLDAFAFQRGARLPAVGTETSGGGTTARPAVVVGTPIARLVIPRLDVDVIVAEGSSDEVLRRAAGHLASSARPGERGNIVIAGHRDTFFRPLAHVRNGDLIILETGSTRLTYRVTWSRVVNPDETYVLSRGGGKSLTLVTCYPFVYVGRAPLRFVVRAQELQT